MIRTDSSGGLRALTTILLIAVLLVVPVATVPATPVSLPEPMSEETGIALGVGAVVTRLSPEANATLCPESEPTPSTRVMADGSGVEEGLDQ